jgi:hypothetical protein
MTQIDPLPFRLRVPGQDLLDSEGVSTIRYRLQGLLHLEDEKLTLEWTATRKTQRVDGSGVNTDVDRSPIGTLEVPVDWITSARLRGGWLWPRLELRARSLDAFDSLPRSRPGVVTLKIRRRDREHARNLVAAIESRRGAGALPGGNAPPRLGE